MNTTYSPIPSDDQSRLPGHGPAARETDLTGGRVDPRASGVSGHDRDLLGAEAAMLSESNHPGQSEFGAFLDDLSQLVRSQKAHGSQAAGRGTQASQPGLTDQIEQRISQARQKLSSALGSAQNHVTDALGSAQSRVSGVIGAIGSAQGRVSDVIGSAQGRVSGALDSAQQARAQATRRVRQGMDRSLDLIQERPLQAVAVAAASGLLVGLLLSSGRR